MEPIRSATPVEIIVNIPGEPQTWNAHDNHTHVQEYRSSIREQYSGRPLPGPIEINCTYSLSPPRALQARIARGEITPAFIGGSPKLEKLNALVLEALQHTLFGSTNQITSLTVTKVYSENPGTLIVLRGTHFDSCSEIEST